MLCNVSLVRIYKSFNLFKGKRKMAKPTISDLARYIAGQIEDNWPEHISLDMLLFETRKALAIFCDKHNVDIKIEKRG